MNKAVKGVLISVPVIFLSAVAYYGLQTSKDIDYYERYVRGD